MPGRQEETAKRGHAFLDPVVFPGAIAIIGTVIGKSGRLCSGLRWILRWKGNSHEHSVIRRKIPYYAEPRKTSKPASRRQTERSLFSR